MFFLMNVSLQTLQIVPPDKRKLQFGVPKYQKFPPAAGWLHSGREAAHIFRLSFAPLTIKKTLTTGEAIEACSDTDLKKCRLCRGRPPG